jgi:hypothetical protein
MKTKPISRRALAAGLALAPVASLSALAKAAKIVELIDNHRSAREAFDRVVDNLERIDDAYRDAHGSEEIIVPSLLGGGISLRMGDEECRKHISSGYENQRRGLAPLGRIAPDLAEQARAALDAKEAENMALVDKLFAEGEERKERFGLAAVERSWKEASEAEEAAARALCAYHCETLEEARIRAEYILATPLIREDGNGEYFEALVWSFLPIEGALESQGTSPIEQVEA